MENQKKQIVGAYLIKYEMDTLWKFCFTDISEI